MAQINGYINFGGNCREAMTFYQECLGGELNLQTVAGSPIEAQCPPAIHQHILHSSLTNGPLLLMASDMMAGRGVTKGNSIALNITCGSEEEINSFYNSLSAGGQVLDPLKVQFWGDMFAALTDKFGVQWLLVYSKNEQ